MSVILRLSELDLKHQLGSMVFNFDTGELVNDTRQTYSSVISSVKIWI